MLEISAGLTDVAGVPAEVAALYYRVRFGGETAGEAEVGRAFPGDVVARLDGSGEKSMHPEFGRRVRMSGSTDYLRTQATSRLMLDNVYSIGASWVTMGPHIGQVALAFGANDMGSLMIEENVVSSAGTTFRATTEDFVHLINAAGFTPVQRDTLYRTVKAY